MKEKETIFQRETANGMIRVMQDEAVRYLHFSDKSIQSSMLRAHPSVLVLAYARYMMTSLLLVDTPSRILMIGLGAGSLANFLHRHFPDCRIDIVEPCEEVIDVARHYFFLPVNEQLTIYPTDGVSYVQSVLHNSSRYDLVLIDAYDDNGIAPSVTALDFYRDCRHLLTSPGVLVANLSRLHPEHLKQSLHELKCIFTDGCWSIPVRGKANVIGLAYKGTGAPTHRQQLYRPAERLQDEHGLDYRDYVDAIKGLSG